MAAVLKNIISCFPSLRLLARIPAGFPQPFLPSGAREFHSSDIMNGGRPKSFWRSKRHPASTRINHELPEKIKERKAFGGHHKLKALRVNKGQFTLKSCDVNLEAPIVKVVHSYANTSHVDTQIIVKGSIVQVEANPFKSWYETHLTNDSPVDNTKNEPESGQVSEEVKKLLDHGVLFAKIDTRPGQVGACNGYILEGQELATVTSNFNHNTTEMSTP